MPDLLAINIHLQDRLERDRRDEVRAPEAARWLDEAGQLADRKGGLPLRILLRAGRIAGQGQRPDRKNGTWFIRRLAASRDPDEIRAARERIRRCLPVDRDALPAGWPVHPGPDVFWQELGKTVAAFGHLERMLGSTCLAHVATVEKAMPFVDGSNCDAAVKWTRRLRRSRLDAMARFTRELDKLLRETGRVPHAVREGLVADLGELRPWRNALCHGAWIDVDEDGCGHLEHLYPDPEDGVPVAFEPRKITPEDLAGVRARTADVTIRVAEAASVSGPPDTGLAGHGYTLAVGMPRMHVPQSAAGANAINFG